ncbi:putative indole-3-pyruvate monooxygenase YUCCA10 [Camellia lanceoleosa]|uniref:Indole-3-pyruvate monooxygenase YUCCA10 n=1 Tax=Camellia lanceoleosa TaxID=1840588 RepID=A0ACC0F7T1_9ERIC|nr:putative indole-3-pyruvate monooxygenase YUCCA10 [Camellia lanceoleosa]
MEMPEPAVIIVGAGTSGLATAACLNRLSIPNIVLEREDCFASLWKKKSYDCLHLHLAKQYCELPHMSYPKNFPTYVPKKQFIQYLDDYVAHFNISPMYNRPVVSAEYDEVSQKWKVKVRNMVSDEVEEYSGKFMVVATGENSDEFIPEVEGLRNFTGEVIHSTLYKCGDKYRDKRVLVVGSGNSGMEIAFDLSNYGAKTSIVVRSPLHIISREMVYLGSVLVKYIQLSTVDYLMVLLSKLIYGDLSKYGIQRPEEGPFTVKLKYGKYPVIDVGTCNKIKSREIQVLPAITSIKGDEVVFQNGKSHPFDAIVFATGFTRSTHKWLKGDNYLLNKDGLANPSFPNHWKGQNGLYCCGLARRGFYGAAMEAQNIADDIKSAL